MNTFLPVLLLLGFSLAGMGQEQTPPAPAKNPFKPGKWYAGIKYEGPPYLTSQRNLFQPGILAGYYFTPKLSLQTGVTVHGRRTAGYLLGENTLVNYRYNPGVYIPLTLRYSFSKPFRRFQSYALAGVHGYFSSFRESWESFANGQSLGKTDAPRVSRNGVGAALGFGVKIRFISRFSLYGEMMLGPAFQRNRDKGYFSSSNRNNLSGLLGTGIVYDFQ